ncbi:hypothetical protein DUE52_18275 [Larkinella punicea]|uniref:Uncharacterized protein n=1 Tax=Larkinella punicea TaxID=2315727 RepID=A0A368JLS3_9BACT|nr:hypothetical protein DUE52_18275 [Larkinella punicea]
MFVRIKSESELVSYFEVPENLSSLELQDKITFQLSQIFSNFFNAYAKAYNRRFGRKGALEVVGDFITG